MQRQELGELVQSSGALGFVGMFFGGALGFFESMARNRPAIFTIANTSINTGMFFASTYIVRSMVKHCRQAVEIKSPLKGFDGAMAGMVSGYVVCRIFGRYGRYASMVGAGWAAGISGIMDTSLADAWTVLDKVEQQHYTE